MNVSNEIENSLIRILPLVCTALGPDFKLKITAKTEDSNTRFELIHKSGAVFYCHFSGYKSDELYQKYEIGLTVNGARIEIRKSFDFNAREKLVKILELIVRKG